MTLKFDGWPWKTIGHLFYATSSFVHHFKAICEFKLELQSGNAQFGSKLAIFCPVWPWNLRDDLKNNNRVPLPCYFKLCASPEMPNLGKNWLFLLQVTLKFERWPWKTIGVPSSTMLLHALCIISWASVNSNSIYSPETLNSGQNRSFLSRVTLKFDGWPWKSIGHLFYATFVHNFIAIGELKLELVWKRSIWVKIFFFTRVTLKFDGKPWNQ